MSGYPRPELLASAYRNAFSLAAQLGLRTIAAPSLSTGAYGYPMDDAARVAVSTAIDFLRDHGEVELIRFVLFGSEALNTYRRGLEMSASETRGASARGPGSSVSRSRAAR